ncbi:MAG: PepSY domain-containing protein [Pseudomonadota bacterium]
MNRLAAAALAGCLTLTTIPSAIAACGIDIATAVRSGGAQDFSNLRNQVSQNANGQIVDVSLCDEGSRLVYRVLVVPQVANAQAQLVRVDAKSGAVLK